jgi:hypothetical protein
MTSYTLRNVSPKLWRRVKIAAATDGMTVRAWILRAILERLR